MAEQSAVEADELLISIFCVLVRDPLPLLLFDGVGLLVVAVPPWW